MRAAWGLAQPTAAFTGFGTDWIDYDNDGWLDLFVANGAVNVVAAQRGQPTPFRMKNQLFRNTGQGRFVETSASAGPAFDAAEIGRGAAFGDIDNDGDTDIVVTNNGGPVQAPAQSGGEPAGQHWLQVRLEQAGRQPVRCRRLGCGRARRPADAVPAASAPMGATCRPATCACTSVWDVSGGRRRGGPVAGRRA